MEQPKEVKQKRNCEVDKAQHGPLPPTSEMIYFKL